MAYHNVENNHILLEWVSRLEQRTRERNILGDLHSLIRNCKTRDALFGAVELAMTDLMPEYNGFISLIDHEGEQAQVVHAWGPDGMGFPNFHTGECTALQQESPVYRSYPPEATPCATCVPITNRGESLCVPLVIDSRFFGTLVLYNKNDEAHFDADQTWLESRTQLLNGEGEKIALALFNLENMGEKRTNKIDETGSREIDKENILSALERAIKRARTQGHQIGLIVVEVRFSSGSDQPIEHLLKERIIQDIGTRLAQNIRRSDIAGRISENTFAAVLEKATPEITRQVIRRLEDEISAPQINNLPYETKLKNLSYPEDGETGKTLLESALSN